MPTTGAPARPMPWLKSNAKKLLVSLLEDESSYIHAEGMTADTIYNSEPLFMQYKIENFRTNYKNLKEKHELELQSIDFDQAAFDKERVLFPRKDTTARGYPFWDKHEARVLMKEDVEMNLSNMKPKDFRITRDEYKQFPPAVFRQHKYQEERKQREKVYWQKKRNDKARKKHEQFMKKQKVVNNDDV
jgi:hypothetical protein